MFDESLWRAWANRERQRHPGFRPALTREHGDVEYAQLPTERLDRLDRGVTELRRRNRSLSDELLAHYGVPVLGRPVGVRPGASGRGRPTNNPKVELAKRWVENWSRDEVH